MEHAKYLKSEQYYLDLHDKQTVEHCRWIERVMNTPHKPTLDKNGEEIDLKPLANAFTEMRVYFEKGEQYLNKRETVRGWMKIDEERDRFFEQAKAPDNITCLACGRLMFVITESEEIGYNERPNRVLYFYDCPLKHPPRRAFYDNGEEYRAAKHQCSKCSAYTEEKINREDDVVTTTWTCSKCGEVETWELDLKPKPTKEDVIDENFEKDRERFCMTDKEGAEYGTWKSSFEALSRSMEEDRKKESQKELYDEVARIKKLKILELEKFLIPQLEKAGFIKFHMKDPDIGKDVFVPFVVYDSAPNRTEMASTHDLSRLIRKVLKGTNWRLMSEGVSYRLGMLEGRLRAYERGEDLVKLIEIKK